nr:hypothetical protein [Tanacetum cinerariifolium]
MHNNSQGTKQEVEDHRRSVKLSKNKTYVTACNDSLNANTLNVKSVVHVRKTCSWWYRMFTPSKYIWKPKSRTENVNLNLVDIVLFIVDSGCSKLMTGNLKLLINFVEKFLGTVKFGNDQIAPIHGYGDLVEGAITIKRVYYVEGLNHNLFSVAKATSSQAWLWHRRLSHLNFDTINLLSKNDIVVGLPKVKFVKDHLYSSFELGKAKRKSFHTKLTPSSKRRLQLLHMDLCGPMRVASINGKRYVLVIVDDYSRYIWTHFLRSKDETPEVLIDFLRLVQKGIQHQMFVARTPKQNGVVERRNRTLVEAARTMLSTAKVPLFFWADAIASACFTQNRSLVIPRHKKTPYHIINDQKPSVKFFHIFGSVCYIVRDGKNLDKMKEKGDECIFVGYSTQSRAYRVFNKRTKVIMKSIHVNFDELPLMASDQNRKVTQADRTVTTSNELDLLFSLMFDELLNGSSKVVSKSFAVSAADAPNQHQISSDPAPECQTMALNHDSLSPAIQRQANVPQADRTVTTSNELDLLFSLMFDELLNGSSKVVSKSSAVSAVDAPNQRQQHTTPLNIHTTPAPTCQVPPLAPTVISSENINQAETYAENDQVTQADRTVTTSNELDLLFSLMFDELLNGSSMVVSKSSAVSAADALNQRQQQTTSLVNHTTPEQSCQVQSHESTVTSNENINQAEPHAENDQVADDEFINIFSTPVQDQGETSSRHVDS